MAGPGKTLPCMSMRYSAADLAEAWHGCLWDVLGPYGIAYVFSFTSAILNWCLVVRQKSHAVCIATAMTHR